MVEIDFKCDMENRFATRIQIVSSCLPRWVTIVFPLHARNTGDDQNLVHKIHVKVRCIILGYKQNCWYLRVKESRNITPANPVPQRLATDCTEHHEPLWNYTVGVGVLCLGRCWTCKSSCSEAVEHSWTGIKGSRTPCKSSCSKHKTPLMTRMSTILKLRCWKTGQIHVIGLQRKDALERVVLDFHLLGELVAWPTPLLSKSCWNCW